MAKTGPKPLAPKEFTAKHAERLNYTLVKILGDREFRVRCNSCDLVRIVRGGSGSTGPKCTCTHKRKFYRVKRTPETHTQELQERGFDDYQCISVGSNAKDEFTYLHTCGNEFSMTKDCFFGCACPCELCRTSLHKDPKAYAQELRKKTKNIEVVGKYVHSQKSLLYRYVKCGHCVKHVPETLMRHKTIGRCPICNPSRVWRRFTVDGKRFRTRSAVEREFVKWLVHEKNVPVDAVEYEPKDCKIRYFNILKDKVCSYSPDFKVNRVHVEVKDLASLGLKEYHWQSKEDAFIENCSKYAEAVSQFDDYRIYVHIKGSFHRVYDFWNRKEQQRLLAL